MLLKAQEIEQKTDSHVNNLQLILNSTWLFWNMQEIAKTRMWANAQPDGCRAKHRWHPLFNAAKSDWRSLLDCRAVTLPRCESRWNLQGCPKLVNRSQPLVGQSSPYCGDIWTRYCCLTSFFSDCRYVPQLRWCQNGDFCVLYFQRGACSTFQTCILNSH